MGDRIAGSWGQRIVAEPPAGCELLDLHNHTSRSYDSSNTVADYRRAHENGRFHVLAITDHNTLDGALQLREEAAFPVIIGEEVDTWDGELIGLFLTEKLRIGISAVATAEAIREQGGLVYLQHPFYPFIRRRLDSRARGDLAARDLIDIVEGLNGGPFMRTKLSDGRARSWALARRLPCAAGSDAHHPGDIGSCLTAIRPGPLTAASLLERLEDACLVNRSRSSATTLLARARYSVSYTAGRALRRRLSKARVPL